MGLINTYDDMVERAAKRALPFGVVDLCDLVEAVEAGVEITTFTADVQAKLEELEAQ